MIKIRYGSDRGHYRNEWLEARFSFSFGHYRDSDYDGYSDLLVLNEDRVQPGQGFAPHSHFDIEAISYPLAGEIEHRDSEGHVARMRRGDVQLMSAGSGITHSEMNASTTDPEHHLQFWIAPARRGLPPSYEQRRISDQDKRDQLRLIASPDGGRDALVLHQNARIFCAHLVGGQISYRPPHGRRTYLHVARGGIRTNTLDLAEGDGAFIEDEAVLALSPAPEGEILLFDLR